MHPEITLMDGVTLNQQNPDTFQIPSEEEKAAVKTGQYVKLGFQHPAMTERMWVRVTEPGKGVLDNDPICIPMICGENVEFEPRHILNILEK